MFVWRVFPGRADARPGAFLTVPMLAECGIRVAFTMRAGGFSDPPNSSLNLTFLAGDDPGAVVANRARVLEAVGAPAEAWTSGRQVHGANVAFVGPNERGRGAKDPETTIPDVDALWTETPGVALAVLVADCVPIVVADVESKRVAVVHAGRKGLLAGVVQKSVAALEEAGSDPGELHAFIGPSIGPCHYEVGEEHVEPARQAFGDTAVGTRDGSVFMDLWAAAGIALASSGVRAVWPAAMCTLCEPQRLFSHRAGSRGRQGVVAVIG